MVIKKLYYNVMIAIACAYESVFSLFFILCLSIVSTSPKSLINQLKYIVICVHICTSFFIIVKQILNYFHNGNKFYYTAGVMIKALLTHIYMNIKIHWFWFKGIAESLKSLLTDGDLTVRQKATECLFVIGGNKYTLYCKLYIVF